MVYQSWPKDMHEDVKHMTRNRNDMIYALEQEDSIPAYWVPYKQRSFLTASQSVYKFVSSTMPDSIFPFLFLAFFLECANFWGCPWHSTQLPESNDSEVMDLREAATATFINQYIF